MGNSRRFAAFGNRNFRLYFLGQTISTIGSWTQSLAVISLVLDIAHRADRLGIATALQFLPMLLLGAPAGVLADKINNRHLLIATSTLSGLIATAFGIVVATGHVTMWWIYILVTLLGLVLSVERPAMQAILFQLVGPDLLPSAIATNSTINSVARLIGPAIAGVLIATAGVSTCFFVNAASYLVVIAALMLLRTHELVHRPMLTHAKGRLREGFDYVRTHPEVARPLWVMVVVGTLVYNFITTFPAMVHFGFHRDNAAISVVMSVSAVGSILGGIFIAGVKPHARRTLVISLAAFAAAVLLMAAMPSYWPFVLMSTVVGFASAVFQSVDTVVLQQATEPAMQGRVMALHQIAWFGSTPIGALLMGWVIQATNPRVPFVLGGVATFLCAVAVLARRSVTTAPA